MEETKQQEESFWKKNSTKLLALAAFIILVAGAYLDLNYKVTNLNLSVYGYEDGYKQTPGPFSLLDGVDKGVKAFNFLQDTPLSTRSDTTKLLIDVWFSNLEPQVWDEYEKEIAELPACLQQELSLKKGQFDLRILPETLQLGITYVDANRYVFELLEREGNFTCYVDTQDDVEGFNKLTSIPCIDVCAGIVADRSGPIASTVSTFGSAS